MRRLPLFAVLLATHFTTHFATTLATDLAAQGRLPICFEANQGQFEPQARFVARGRGFRLLLTDAGPVMTLCAGKGSATVLRTRLVGATGKAPVNGQDPLPGRVHYYRGSNPSKWSRDVRTWRKVRYTAVYPGIDLIYYGNQGQLEYDFVVAPGASPKRIRLRFDGAEKLRVDKTGDLVLMTGGGELRHRAPFAYQEIGGRRQRVAANYKLGAENTVSFELGRYDADRTLTIDPVLVYATYLGGNQSDQDVRLAVDRDGHAIITGWTFSTDFPTKGSVSSKRTGSTDVFVTKLTKDGSDIVWSTYLGGSVGETPGDVAVAADGSIAVCGTTTSADFPFQSPFQDKKPSAATGFVSVFDKNGGLQFSTFYGGVKFGSTNARAIVFDGSDVLIAGNTQSTDLPGVSGAFQDKIARLTDAFIARLARSGGKGAIRGATYLGGNITDGIESMALGQNRTVCVMGVTSSTDLPTKNGFQAKNAGRRDAFVAVFNSGLGSMLYGTLVGGTHDEMQGRVHMLSDIAVGPRGHIHAVGDTFSKDYPTTVGAYDRKFQAQEGFLVKIDPTKVGSQSLLVSTMFGGDGGEVLQSVDVDAAGNIFLGGFSNARKDFPLKHALFQPRGTAAGRPETVIAVLDPTGSKLLFSTAFGGVGHEDCSGLVLGPGGDVFFAGYSGSSGSAGIQTTANAFQKTAPPGPNTYVARMRVPLAMQENYGQGHPGSNGVPALTLSDRPVLGEQVNLNVGNSRGANTTGLLFIGFQQANVVTPFGGTQLLVPAFQLLFPVPNGGLALPVTIPKDHSNCGVTVLLQLLQLDPKASAGISFSRGLRLLVGI